MRRRRVSIVLCAVIGVGCDDGGGGSGGEKGLPAADFAEEAAKVACSAFERCLGPAVDLFLGGQSCADGPGRQIEDSFSDLEALIASGRVIYDGEQAKTCLPALEVVACGELDAAFDSLCDEALKGTVESGGDCDRDEECAGDANCVLAAACPGKCTPSKQKGEDCEEDEDCAGGLACSAGACALPLADGQDCSDTLGACKLGSLCVGEDEEAGPGLCEPLGEAFAAKEGEPCDIEASSFCARGLSCVVTSADESGITMACQKPVAADASCNFGLPPPCVAGQYCNAQIDQGQIEGTCVDLPGAGEACVDAPGAAPCQPGLVCVEGTSTCKMVAGLGEACTDDAECTSESCVKGKCVLGLGCTLD